MTHFFYVELVISPVIQSTDDAIQRNGDDDVQENVVEVIVPIEQNVAPSQYTDDRRSHSSIRPPLLHKDFVMTNKKKEFPASHIECCELHRFFNSIQGFLM